MPARQNNFDALRLVAAISVIFSHSFLIAEGTQNNEPLILWTGNQSILGLAGVFVFFAISGFLVTQSFEQTANPLHYLAKRALRIFPGLFIVTLVSAFVLGPLVTTLPLGAYLGRPEPYQYVVGNTLLDQTVHELPGVSFVDNPVGLEINGSLWTLRCEFVMYLMVLVLGVLRLLTVRVGLARRLFCGRHGPLQAAPHPHLRRPHRTLGVRRPRPQHPAAPIHPAVPDIRLLSGALACPQSAFAGHPGSPLRRSLLWSLHLWLAGGRGRDVVLRRPCRVVAGIPDCAAGGLCNGIPVVAPGRAPDAPLQTRFATRRGALRAGGPAGIVERTGAELCSPVSMALRSQLRGRYADADTQPLHRSERPVPFPGHRGRMGRGNALGQALQAPAGDRHHLPRGP